MVEQSTAQVDLISQFLCPAPGMGNCPLIDQRADKVNLYFKGQSK